MAMKKLIPFGYCIQEEVSPELLKSKDIHTTNSTGVIDTTRYISQLGWHPSSLIKGLVAATEFHRSHDYSTPLSTRLLAQKKQYGLTPLTYRSENGLIEALFSDYHKIQPPRNRIDRRDGNSVLLRVLAEDSMRGPRVLFAVGAVRERPYWSAVFQSQGFSVDYYVSSYWINVLASLNENILHLAKCESACRVLCLDDSTTTHPESSNICLNEYQAYISEQLHQFSAKAAFNADHKSTLNTLFSLKHDACLSHLDMNYPIFCKHISSSEYDAVAISTVPTPENVLLYHWAIQNRIPIYSVPETLRHPTGYDSWDINNPSCIPLIAQRRLFFRKTSAFEAVYSELNGKLGSQQAYFDSAIKSNARANLAETENITITDNGWFGEGIYLHIECTLNQYLDRICEIIEELRKVNRTCRIFYRHRPGYNSSAFYSLDFRLLNKVQREKVKFISNEISHIDSSSSLDLDEFARKRTALVVTYPSTIVFEAIKASVLVIPVFPKQFEHAPSDVGLQCSQYIFHNGSRYQLSKPIPPCC